MFWWRTLRSVRFLDTDGYCICVRSSDSGAWRRPSPAWSPSSCSRLTDFIGGELSSPTGEHWLASLMSTNSQGFNVAQGLSQRVAGQTPRGFLCWWKHRLTEEKTTSSPWLPVLKVTVMHGAMAAFLQPCQAERNTAETTECWRQQWEHQRAPLFGEAAFHAHLQTSCGNDWIKCLFLLKVSWCSIIHENPNGLKLRCDNTKWKMMK